MTLCLPYWKSPGISCGLESGDPDITQNTYFVSLLASYM